MMIHSRLVTLFALLCFFSFAPTAFAQDFVPGELIVKFKGKSNHKQVSQFQSKMGGAAQSRALSVKSNVHHFKVSAHQDIQSLIHELRQDPNVEYAEPNWILRRAEVVDEDNRTFSIEEVRSQVSSSGSYAQNYASVKVTEAWAQVSIDAAAPVVAIIDTGVDYSHPIFSQSNALWTNSKEVPGNGIDDDGNGFIDDVHGWNFFGDNNSPIDDDQHGTHVAGIILGIGQDIFATTLASARIKIMPLKFLGADGSGSTSDAIAAIHYAVDNGARVINNSWGGPNYSQGLHDALKYAYDHNVVLVAAAGNYGKNNDVEPLYPAGYQVPSQLTVAATNDWDNLASFSNYGATTVHLAAPGVGIFSTIPGNSFKFMSGTSMAAPFIAGLAAMVVREAPNLSGYQVKSLLMSSGDRIATLSTKTVSSNRANAYTSLVSSKAQVAASSYNPEYVAAAPASRTPAATSDEKKGCGLVRDIGEYGGPGAGTGVMIVSFVFLSLPMVTWFAVRRKLKGQNVRRKHQRYLMDSEIRIFVGDKEVLGQTKTIGAGGLSFQTNSMIETGQIVPGEILTMSVQSPDGSGEVQVQGKIVWSQKDHSYGVQFANVTESVISHIRSWSGSLVKT